MTFSKNTFIPALIFIIIIINAGFLLYSNGLSNFHYSLDDPFIHLEIAKNIVDYGNYGINSNEFTSPSSSPIWTFLIALCIKLFGDYELIPLFLNILLTFPTVIILSKLNNSFEYKFLLTFVLLVASIPALIVNGMEHILHICLFSYLFFKVNYNFENNKSNLNSIILCLFLLLPLVRYEFLFFSFIISLLLFYKRNFNEGLILGIVSVLGIIAFGLYSIQNGATFIPSSILIKSDLNQTLSFIGYIKKYLLLWIVNLSKVPEIICILLVISVLFLINTKTKYKYHFLTFSSLVFLHSYFAKFGWLYRYEAYIIVIGLTLILLNFIENISIIKKVNRKFVFISISIFSLLFINRFIDTNMESKKAIEKLNIQQFQMAKFVKEYYNNKSVALNDIGAVAYYSDSYIIDLFGLGNSKIAVAKLNNNDLDNIYQSELIDNNCELMIIYKNWFDNLDEFANDYVEVCDWTTDIDVWLGDQKITFLAKSNLKKRVSSEIKEFLKINFENNPPFKVKYYD